MKSDRNLESVRSELLNYIQLWKLNIYIALLKWILKQESWRLQKTRFQTQSRQQAHKPPRYVYENRSNESAALCQRTNASYADMPNCTELCLDCQYESCNSFWLTFELWPSHNWRSRETKCKSLKFCKPSLGKQGIFPKLGRKSLRAEKCRNAFFSLLGIMLSNILTNIQKANFWKCYYADLTARCWYMETCFSGKANYI